LVGSHQELLEAGLSMAYPVVLKTAAPGILHKSDVGGVILDVIDTPSLIRAYTEMHGRLGAAAIVAEMAPKGIELALGAVVDPQWGPIVLISAGGVLVELLDDSAAALAPLSRDEAKAMVASLKINRLLDGYRGSKPVDREGVIDAIFRLSWLVADFPDLISEIDVNPLIASADGCIAVDALIIPQSSNHRVEPR
jgi:acyl-CoA synthetase (NDP forming)